jgi:transcriptional regulator with XRE-family HTH domain
MTTFSKYLEMKYLEWQRQTGGRRTVAEFANHLGVSQQTVSSWWNYDKIPQGENIQKIALKLGLEVYDILGIPRPDSDLHYIQTYWDEFTQEERQALKEQAERYAANHDKPGRDYKKRRT